MGDKTINDKIKELMEEILAAIESEGEMRRLYIKIYHCQNCESRIRADGAYVEGDQRNWKFCDIECYRGYYNG